MIALTTPTGQTIRVAEDRVSRWEARGFKRVEQPAPVVSEVDAEVEKAPAKKSAPKKSSK